MVKKQIVIFCGSFNPPLNSHFSLAQQMVNEYDKIGKIIFVPVNDRYEKAELVSNEHRYKMLKLVCDKNEKFDVSRIEIDSPRPLYTIETLKEFKEAYEEYEIALVIGSDNLKELDTWNNSLAIMKEFKIYVLKRDNDNIEEIIQSSRILMDNKEAFIKVENNIATNLSSTFIREKIKAGKSIRYLAPEEVINYIEENKLFC